MLKNRIVSVFVGLALLLAVTTLSTVVADSVGWSLTPPAFACDPPGSGGGC